MAKKPVKDSWDDKIIKTGIDGYTDSYAINDLIPHHTGNNGPLDVNLYIGIQDTWDDRQTANNVPVHIWTTTAITAGAIDQVLDAQAVSQYFLNSDSNKRIVVFGHTHKALIYPFANLKLQKTVYANSGTWVDKADPTMTFVVIIPQKSSEATTEYISTYQYSQSGTINKLDSSVITNMKFFSPSTGVYRSHHAPCCPSRNPRDTAPRSSALPYTDAAPFPDHADWGAPRPPRTAVDEWRSTSQLRESHNFMTVP